MGKKYFLDFENLFTEGCGETEVFKLLARKWKGIEMPKSIRRPPITPFETKQRAEGFTSAARCDIENEGFWRLP